jgi:Flp pilus assembly protein TadD
VTADPSLAFDNAVEAFRRGELDQARTLAERGVAASPTPQWHHLLGLIHCRLGDLGKGVEHLRAAADAEPGNAAFQVMLARALVDAGNPAQVLEMPEPPVPNSPATLALWQARAEAADSAENLEAAAAAWRKVADGAPRDWRAWSNLGNALAGLGRWHEAAEALSAAVDLNPAEPAIRRNAVAAVLQAGRIDLALDRFDEAEMAFRYGYELEPANPSAVQQLGIALERTNRLDDLRSLIDSAVAAGVPDEKLHFLRAVLARREGRLDEARELLLRSDPHEEPVRWPALRAKIADQLGEVTEAFDAASQMNKARFEQSVNPAERESWEKQARDYRADLHELARMITPQWAARIPRLKEQKTKRLSFLLGFPRSGTTLLDTFLMGHPKVVVLEEKQLVGRSADLVGGSAGLADAAPPLLRKARQTYFDLLGEYVGDDFAGVVVDKFPLDMAAAPVIEAMFPGTPMIFAQRHPCDVVLSGFMQPVGIVNFSSIEAAADYYDAMMSIWAAARETLRLNVHTVVYEDMVRDPEATLRPLLEFLGLDWDERVLDHRRTARERGTIITPSYDQVTEAVTTRASGRWKKYRKQLDPVLPILLPWAERLGYRDE